MKEFCWNELLTKDVEKSKKFYTHLLGWTAVESKHGDCTYTMFQDKGKDVAGLMENSCCGSCSHEATWLAYVTVEDVDETVKHAEKLGGKVKVEPMDFPGVGRIAVIIDCCGAKIGLFAKK